MLRRLNVVIRGGRRKTGFVVDEKFIRAEVASAWNNCRISTEAEENKVAGRAWLGGVASVL